MPTTADRGIGYLETTFKERLGLARKQRTEIAKEKGIMGRILKDVGRADWKQQRQQQYARVKHVARIGASQPRRSHVLGMPTMRGTAKSRGQATMGVRGQKKTAAQLRASASRSPSVYSAGGVAQLSARKRWTASGGQVVDKQKDRSVFHKPQQVIDPYTPMNIFKKKDKGTFRPQVRAFAPGAAKGGRRGQRGTGYGGPLGKGSTRTTREARISQQRQLARKARLETYKRLIVPKRGPEAAKLVMDEFNKRQEALYGMEGPGKLTPAMLWGDVVRA